MSCFTDKINSYCSTLTESELNHFIKNTKVIFDEKFLALEEKEEQEKYDERKNLNRYKLFFKKNYYIHLMSKNICNFILSVSPNAYVYGGFIRDNILHDFTARKYYENNENEPFEKYNDPKFDKETSLRTLVPSDIDVIFKDMNDYLKFTKLLLHNDFSFINIGSLGNDDKYKTPGKKNYDDNLVKFKIEVKNNESLQKLKWRNTDYRFLNIDFANTVVTVDITISENYYPSFDFLCNSLIISKDGFIFRDDSFYFDSVGDMINANKTQSLLVSEIENQIQNMESVIESKNYSVNSPAKYRVIKMLRKGWRLKYKNPSGLISQLSNKDNEECCILCRDKFNEVANVPGVHRLFDGLKIDCCLCGYHPKCLLQILENTNYVHKIMEDVVYYKCIQCSKVSIKFSKSDMNEFLTILKESWDIFIDFDYY